MRLEGRTICRIRFQPTNTMDAAASQRRRRMYHGCGESSSRRPLRDFARRSERTVLRLVSSMNRAYHRVSVIDPSIKSSTEEWSRARPLLPPSVMSGRLARYKDFAWFVAKYGRADFVTKAMAGDDAAASDPAAAEAFATDLEPLGPTFIKLGQILSIRARISLAGNVGKTRAR